MAIADEQDGVLPKHFHKETRGPAVGKICLPEVSVGQHKVRARVLNCAVQVHNSGEFSTQWKRGANKSVARRVLRSGGHREMTVEIRGHETQRVLTPKQLHNGVMKVA